MNCCSDITDEESGVLRRPARLRFGGGVFSQFAME
jgi:hypothetical protein